MSKKYIRLFFVFRGMIGVLCGALFLTSNTGVAAQTFKGNTSGIFENPVLESNGTVSGVGTNFFTWGQGAFGSPPSSLQLGGTAFTTDEDEIFSLGTLTFFNGTIFANTGANAVDLKVTIMLTMPSGVTEELVQTLTLINTPNIGTPTQQADRVSLPTEMEITFEVAGVEHTLEILGFGTITGNGGASLIHEFFVLEGGLASAELLGRISACADPGFQLTQEEVPGTGKKLCYKGNVSKSFFGLGTMVSFALDLKNPHSDPMNFVVCAMVNTRAGAQVHPRWDASLSGNTWTCTQNGTVTQPSSFHFGCRAFSIPGGETRHWRDQGTLPLFNRIDDMYIDFLQDFPIENACSYTCTGPNCVRGENHFLVPDRSVGGALFSNIWAVMVPMESLSPQLGCTMEWEVGNWITMRDPDTYLARLNGTIIDAPAGSIVTFHFPPGSPQTVRTFVVPPANPANPTCLGQQIGISEPFVIPPGPATISMDIVVPEECSALREGTRVRFLGEAVGDVGSPVFQPGEFIVGYAGTCVVDSTSAQVEQLNVTPLGGGLLDVQVAATDAITAPLATLLRFRPNGGPEQEVVMNFDDPPVAGETVFFRQTIGPFPAGATVEVTAEAFDDVGNSAPSAPTEEIVPLDIDIKPQSCPNPLNVTSTGNLPVAILGTEAFDVNDIDLESILVEGVPPVKNSIEDVSTPVVSGEECECTTDGADGFDDLTLKFDTQSIVAALGTVNDGDEVVVTLTGNLTDGTPIEGMDCVIIKSKGRGASKSIAEGEEKIPESYALAQNYPNPFNPETEIRFQLPEDSHVVVRIFNTLGQEIRTLVDSPYAAGFHTIRWDSKDNNGNVVSSGVYLYQLQAGNFSKTRKMILIR